MVQPLAASHQVELQFHADADDHGGRGDRTRLRQILVNLLTNAIKYNRNGGRVDLSLCARAGQISVSIADTGRGLAPEQIAALFQPFNRLGAETSGVEGTGLGSVITKQLAEAMHGTLTVSSTPGVGSVFTLGLPQGPRVRADPSPSPDLLVNALGLADAAPMVLLYVEDNPANVTLMRHALRLRPTTSNGPSMKVFAII